MTIRPLFEINEDEPVPPVDAPKIVDRRQEAKRVVKRITSIIDDHRHACLALKVTLGESELNIVIDALRDHAKGGPGTLDLSNNDIGRDGAKAVAAMAGVIGSVTSVR